MSPVIEAGSSDSWPVRLHPFIVGLVQGPCSCIYVIYVGILVAAICSFSSWYHTLLEDPTMCAAYLSFVLCG